MAYNKSIYMIRHGSSFNQGPIYNDGDFINISGLGLSWPGGSTGKIIKIGTLSSTTPGSGAFVDATTTRALEVNVDDNNTARAVGTQGRAIFGRTMIYADNACEDWGVHGLSKVSAVAKTGNVSAGVVGAFESTGTCSTATGSGNSYCAGVMGRVGTGGSFTIGSGTYVACVLAFGNNANSNAFTNSGYHGFHVALTDVGTPEVFDVGLCIEDSAATTGIDIGTCTTGIDVSGTVTDGLQVDAATDSAVRITGTPAYGINMGAATTGISMAGAMTDGILISGACSDNAIEITGACSDSAIKIVGTALIASGEQAIFVNCANETAAVNAGWFTIKSTVTSGDIGGLRAHVTSNAASGGSNIRALRGEAIIGASKYAALGTGALIEVDYSAVSCECTTIEVLCIQTSEGASLTATNFAGIKMNLQTRGDESFGGYDAGIYLVNEGHGGAGRTIADGILIAESAHSAATAFTDAIHVSANCTNIITVSGTASYFADFDNATTCATTTESGAATTIKGNILVKTVAGATGYINVYGSAGS